MCLLLLRLDILRVCLGYVLVRIQFATGWFKSSVDCALFNLRSAFDQVFGWEIVRLGPDMERVWIRSDFDVLQVSVFGFTIDREGVQIDFVFELVLTFIFRSV